MADYSGAAVIFGTTGGVMEAALRTAYYKIMKKNPNPDIFSNMKIVKYGEGMWKEATFDMNGIVVKIAVTSGLKNAKELCRAILRKDYKYDFVEIMACPGGCSGGGGQPIHTDDIERADERGKMLRDIDKSYNLRYSHENKDVIDLYDNFLGAPLGELSEELLHKDQNLR